MPAGLTKRIYKKRYKAALTRIADKCPAAFSGKKDKRRWISEVTNQVICVRCCLRWIDVRPEGTLLKNLECPECGQAGGVIETGEEIDDQDRCDSTPQ